MTAFQAIPVNTFLALSDIIKIHLFLSYLLPFSKLIKCNNVRNVEDVCITFGLTVNFSGFKSIDCGVTTTIFH